MLFAGFVKQAELLGNGIPLKAGVSRVTGIYDLDLTPCIARIEGYAGAHIVACLCTGIAEYGNVLCAFGKNGFILDILQRYTKEGCVASAECLFLEEIVIAEITPGCTAVGGGCDTALAVLEVCTGVVGKSAVCILDKSALAGTYLNAVCGLPGLAVVIGVNGVVVGYLLKSVPVGVGADACTGCAEKSALIFTVL